jgi:hypothetical protein
MPNRNAADEREKYDHSGHSTQHRQKGDLKPPGAGSAGEPKHDKPNARVPEPKDPH